MRTASTCRSRCSLTTRAFRRRNSSRQPLQEHDRATLVGTHTTGKGRAQRTYQLSDGSAVNLSVEEYFTPKGKSLADVGIAPDIEVKLTDEQTQNFFFLTSETDPQLQKAMETVG